MKNNKGITLIIVIIIVILLLIISGLSINYGIDSYNKSKVVRFEAYMKLLQKKVDIALEEGIDYTELGSPLTQEQETKLQKIISSNSSIETQSLTDAKLRYFSSSQIKETFDLGNVYDDIVVNFENRDVICLNGVKKDGVMHYVEYTLY